MESTLPPARWAWIAELQVRLGLQDVPQAGEADRLFGSLAEQLAKKCWAFEPPMAEQFGIKWRNKEWIRGRHCLLQAIQLPTASGEVIPGMDLDLSRSDLRVVGLFPVQGNCVIGDPMQFQAEWSWGVQPQRLEGFQRKIPAEVTVEFPVGRMTGIAIFGRPHRQGGFAVSPKEGDAVAAANGRVHPIAGSGSRVQQTMAVLDGQSKSQCLLLLLLLLLFLRRLRCTHREQQDRRTTTTTVTVFDENLIIPCACNFSRITKKHNSHFFLDF